jgi:hypothetical protein
LLQKRLDHSAHNRVFQFTIAIVVFIRSFLAILVLEQSRWEMGQIKKDKAEVITTFYKSEHPALLKIFLEKRKGGVGLVETFWGRK